MTVKVNGDAALAKGVTFQLSLGGDEWMAIPEDLRREYLDGIKQESVPLSKKIMMLGALVYWLEENTTHEATQTISDTADVPPPPPSDVLDYVPSADEMDDLMKEYRRQLGRALNGTDYIRGMSDEAVRRQMESALGVRTGVLDVNRATTARRLKEQADPTPVKTCAEVLDDLVAAKAAAGNDGRKLDVKIDDSIEGGYRHYMMKQLGGNHVYRRGKIEMQERIDFIEKGPMNAVAILREHGLLT